MQNCSDNGEGILSFFFFFSASNILGIRRFLKFHQANTLIGDKFTPEQSVSAIKETPTEEDFHYFDHDFQ